MQPHLSLNITLAVFGNIPSFISATGLFLYLRTTYERSTMRDKINKLDLCNAALDIQTAAQLDQNRDPANWFSLNSNFAGHAFNDLLL